MDHKRMKSFLQIAELGSISKASDRLRIAQPALSRQMRILEDELGMQLFSRHRRGMQLTPMGEELRKRIAGPLRQLNQAVEDIRSMSEITGGNLSFGMPPTVSYVLAGRLARRVAETAPKLSLRVVEGYAGHLVDWLQRGEIDAAIIYGPATDFHMNVQELLFEELVVVGPPGSDLTPDGSIAFADFATHPLVLPSHPHGLRIVVENAAAKAQVKLDVRFEADSFLVMKELVEAGLCLTALPLSAITREAEAGRLLYTPLVKPSVRRQLILGTQRESTQSLAARTIVRLVREEIVALVGSGRWKAHLQFDLDSRASH